MKNPVSLAAALLLTLAPLAGFAQDYGPPPPPPPPPSDQAGGGALDQLPPLDQLVAPIALYPDPIIALMLPAAAYPDQLQAAAGNPNDPNFDPAIQGLEHYPSVLQWMAANPTWTQQVGGAFATEPGDVMAAIQDLRQRARSAGTLAPSNYEQIVVDGNGQIEILPAQPDEIYIPTYDPAVVYWGAPGAYPGSYFAWSDPYPLGAWLAFDFDWHGRALYQGNWYAYRRSYGWNRPIDFSRGVAVRGAVAWRAPANHPPAPSTRGFSRIIGRSPAVVQPRPVGGRAAVPSRNEAPYPQRAYAEPNRGEPQRYAQPNRGEPQRAQAYSQARGSSEQRVPYREGEAPARAQAYRQGEQPARGEAQRQARPQQQHAAPAEQHAPPSHPAPAPQPSSGGDDHREHDHPN